MKMEKDKKELVKKIADEAKDMEPFKDKVTDDLRYSQACIDHREKLKMEKFDEKTLREMNLQCDRGRFCYDEGCPIFVPDKKLPKFYCDICKVTVTGDATDNVPNLIATHNKTRFHQVNLNGTKDLGQGFKTDGTRHIPKVTKDNPLGINLEVFEEIDAEKTKKKKEKSVREFLNIQMRVLEKLSWHPEIYEALDNLPTSEILDRLLGKTGLEGVATHVGGDMKLKASPKAKALFENLEKQFADEDEKKGKGAPPNYETVGHLPADRDFTFTWVDDKEEKKNGKKTSKK